jgi:hypothetical protein
VKIMRLKKDVFMSVETCPVAGHDSIPNKQVIRACLYGVQGIRKCARKGGRRLGFYMTERHVW